MNVSDFFLPFWHCASFTFPFSRQQVMLGCTELLSAGAGSLVLLLLPTLFGVCEVDDIPTHYNRVIIHTLYINSHFSHPSNSVLHNVLGRDMIITNYSSLTVTPQPVTVKHDFASFFFVYLQSVGLCEESLALPTLP